MELSNTRPSSNRSGVALEFKTDKKGDVSIIGNKDALIALSLLLDKAIESESTHSTKFRRRERLDQDIIVSFKCLEQPYKNKSLVSRFLKR